MQIEMTIIGKKNCPWCTKAKELLEKNNIKYTYLEVLKEDQDREEGVEYIHIDELKTMFPYSKTVPIITRNKIKLTDKSDVIVDHALIGTYKDLEDYLVEYFEGTKSDFCHDF